MKRTALVFGATGLIGRSLVDQLCKSDSYDKIVIFMRGRSPLSGKAKTETIIIDFDRLSDYSGYIRGDDLFICTGTTIKKAGSVSKMEEIDRDLPLKIGTIASANDVKRVTAVSSVGADMTSSNYYLRIKGEMEKGLLDLKFDTVSIVRPSILLGERKERRAGEALGKFMISILGYFMIGKLRKYRGIKGADVAKAMIRIMMDSSGKEIFESDELQKIAKD